jgi:3-isopropylmalate/(R)-2-methylmalate dehydratase small subunit
VEANPATEITVDLSAQKVIFAGKEVGFEIDSYTKWRLMEGLDDIGLTLQKTAEIDGFEGSRPAFKPKTLPIRS